MRPVAEEQRPFGLRAGSFFDKLKVDHPKRDRGGVCRARIYGKTAEKLTSLLAADEANSEWKNHGRRAAIPKQDCGNEQRSKMQGGQAASINGDFPRDSAILP